MTKEYQEAIEKLESTVKRLGLIDRICLQDDLKTIDNIITNLKEVKNDI